MSLTWKTRRKKDCKVQLEKEELNTVRVLSLTSLTQDMCCKKSRIRTEGDNAEIKCSTQASDLLWDE